jgi:hypothetical protein
MSTERTILSPQLGLCAGFGRNNTSIAFKFVARFFFYRICTRTSPAVQAYEEKLNNNFTTADHKLSR